MIETPEDLIRPEVENFGADGNALSLVGSVARELRRVGNTPEVVDAFRKEALSGDYDHVVQTCMAYAEVD